ncbi:MAG TPA: DUF547 domain-containing protein [Candidatus Bathyarchaeia archaeon]|nr:DUF547 domain-containing protein [Candidatus Bathyarchaeia archaeon]
MLNEAATAGAAAPAAVAEDLQRALLGVIGAFTRPDGRLDYGCLRASPEWREAAARAGALHAVSLADLAGRPARLAFWINVYNAMVFHGIVALGVRRTVGEVRGFFARVSYRIGGFVLSADDVEHGILRANARHGRLRRRCFGRRDPRLALTVHPVDPRIHFAITCGAQSCPPVSAYRAAAIEQQLDLAARNFLNQEVALDGRGCVTCSRILRWYAADFAASGGLGPFLLRYLDPGPVREAVAARPMPCERYRDYDWALQHEPAE